MVIVYYNILKIVVLNKIKTKRLIWLEKKLQFADIREVNHWTVNILLLSVPINSIIKIFFLYLWSCVSQFFNWKHWIRVGT